MAEKPTKKYLLYIHDERFRAEKEKSGLVNKLLKDHYGFWDNPRKTLPKIPGVSVGFCKHDYAKGLCKYGCK